MNRRSLLAAFLALPVASRFRPWVRPEAETVREGDWIVHGRQWLTENWTTQPAPILVPPAMFEMWERIRCS